MKLLLRTTSARNVSDEVPIIIQYLDILNQNHVSCFFIELDGVFVYWIASFVGSALVWRDSLSSSSDQFCKIRTSLFLTMGEVKLQMDTPTIPHSNSSCTDSWTTLRCASGVRYIFCPEGSLPLSLMDIFSPLVFPSSQMCPGMHWLHSLTRSWYCIHGNLFQLY